MVGRKGFSIGSSRNYGIYACVYVKNINRIYCSEASVHRVFFVLVLWYGRGLRSAKEKAAFNVLQLRRTVVYELSNCDPHMPETPWKTYLLPVNYDVFEVSDVLTTKAAIPFSRQLHRLLSHVFHSFPKNGTCCNGVCNYRWNWSDLADSTASLRRSKTKSNIYIYIIRM